MRNLELYIEYIHNGQFKGAKRIRSTKGPFVIGSSRACTLRLLGEDIAGVHAVIEYRHPYWVISDCGGGILMNSLPLMEHKIAGGEIFNLGTHEIRISVSEPVEEVFKTNYSGEHGYNAHQVVVLMNSEVLKTEFLGVSEEFELEFAGASKSFSAPRDGIWQENKYGNFTIRQRLIYTPNGFANTKPGLSLLKEKELRAPFTLSMVMFFCFVFVSLIGEVEKEEEIVPPKSNKFVKMIYDADLMNNLKKEARQLTQRKIKPVANRHIASEVKPKRKLVTKVIKNIKAKGLSKLIGKIAKRAAQNTLKIQALGKTAEHQTSRALASVGGSINLEKEDTASKKSFRVNKVKTKGKAGGTSAYKTGSGLAKGNTGAGQVGIVEEESIVDGGLDKEVIAEYIRSKIGQIRYCYERQLSAKPELAGKVLVKFTIGSTGKVATQGVKNTTLDNSAVEGCILRRIAKWKFPTPKGGTKVVVSYPFLFKSVN